MRLISLSLRGHVGIERGLGIDQVDIDFEQFDGGLVALVAKNGSGKTTLLESCTPFRTLVSRPGALQNHCYLRDSHRILRFEKDGSVYECKLLIDAQSGKQEAVLIRDGQPLNDSKTTTYDAEVKEIFGSEELFFRSLFRSQNAESITDLRASERKALFVELLGLAHIQGYHESAKTKANAKNGEVEGLRAKIETLKESTGDVSLLRAELGALALAQEAMQGEISLLKADEKVAEKAIEKLRIDLAAFDDKRTRLASLTNEVTKAAEALAAAEARHDALVESHAAERGSLEDRIGQLSNPTGDAAKDDSLTDAHTGERKPLEERIERLNRILKNREQIETKIAELATARESVAEQVELKAKYDAAAAALGDAQRELAEAKASHGAIVSEADRALDAAQAAFRQRNNAHSNDIDRLTRDKDALLAKIARAEGDAELLGDVWCTGMEGENVCKVLAGARASRDELTILRESLKEQQATIDDRNNLDIMSTDEAVAVQAAEKALEAAQDARTAALDEIGNRLESLQDDVDIVGYDAEEHATSAATVKRLESEGWERLQIEANSAAGQLAESNTDLQAMTERHAGELEAAKERQRIEAEKVAAQIAQANADLQAMTERHALAISSSKAQVDELNERADSLDKQRDALAIELEGEAEQRTDLENIQRTLARDVEKREGFESDLRQRDNEIAALRVKIQQAEESQIKIDTVQIQLDTVLTAHGRWALLARATGKDGIQALELDAAGPNVSAIANQLLADTFGSQFQIAFETTKLSADGKKQLESFEIKVFSDGTEQTIENLSGGQRVWVEAAISQAIAIYLRQKSGLDLRTSFLDEADGALDADNAFRYLSMLRSAHELAGIHHTLLITHRQELLAHIPQQIRLVPGVGVEYAN